LSVCSIASAMSLASQQMNMRADEIWKTAKNAMRNYVYFKRA